jgi:hypothetical protein
MEDIRPRLAIPRRPRRGAWPWLLPAAAALVLAAWLGQRRPLRSPSRPSAAAPGVSAPPAVAGRGRAPSLSPFQTVRLPPTRAVPLPSLSATGVAGMGAALSGGAHALSLIRPPMTLPHKEE